MASISYNLRIDRLENAVLAELSGPVRDEMLEAGRAIKEEVQSLIRQRSAEPTGGLEGSIQGSLDDVDGESWMIIVYSDHEAALGIEDGTGIHGPRSAYIFPKGPGPMIFFHRGLRRKVWAFKVEGQEGKHMFRDGLDNVIGRGGAQFVPAI